MSFTEAGTTGTVHDSLLSALTPHANFCTDVDSLGPAFAPVSNLRMSIVEYERSPIQNSPWKESSLDQPYLKAAKPQPAGSSSSSR